MKNINSKTKICSICSKPIDVDEIGWDKGHNAMPINDGRCCTSCNEKEVIPARKTISRFLKSYGGNSTAINKGA